MCYIHKSTSHCNLTCPYLLWWSWAINYGVFTAQGTGTCGKHDVVKCNKNIKQLRILIVVRCSIFIFKPFVCKLSPTSNVEFTVLSSGQIWCKTYLYLYSTKWRVFAPVVKWPGLGPAGLLGWLIFALNICGALENFANCSLERWVEGRSAKLGWDESGASLETMIKYRWPSKTRNVR